MPKNTPPNDADRMPDIKIEELAAQIADHPACKLLDYMAANENSQLIKKVFTEIAKGSGKITRERLEKLLNLCKRRGGAALAIVKISGQGEGRSAEEQADKIFKQIPYANEIYDHITTPEKKDFQDYYNEIRRLKTEDKIDEALELAKETADVFPNNEALYIELAGIYDRLGDKESELATWQKALEVCKSSARNWYANNIQRLAGELGEQSWEKSSDTPDEKDKEDEPEKTGEAEYFDKLDALLMAGKEDEAWELGQKAVEDYPNSTLLYKQMAVIARSRGDEKAELTAWKKALATANVKLDSTYIRSQINRLEGTRDPLSEPPAEFSETGDKGVEQQPEQRISLFPEPESGDRTSDVEEALRISFPDSFPPPPEPLPGINDVTKNQPFDMGTPDGEFETINRNSIDGMNLYEVWGQILYYRNLVEELRSSSGLDKTQLNVAVRDLKRLKEYYKKRAGSDEKPEDYEKWVNGELVIENIEDGQMRIQDVNDDEEDGDLQDYTAPDSYPEEPTKEVPAIFEDTLVKKGEHLKIGILTASYLVTIEEGAKVTLAQSFGGRVKRLGKGACCEVYEGEVEYV